MNVPSLQTLQTLRAWLIERRHELSRVFTLPAVSYRVCLDCGAEFEYSLRTMRLTGRRLRRRPQQFDVIAMEREWERISGQGVRPHAGQTIPEERVQLAPPASIVVMPRWRKMR